MNIKEKVTVVAIEFGHVVLILLAAAEEPFLHRNHIVHIALLDLEYLVELVGRIDRVTCPGDVAEIITPPFFKIEIDAQTVGLDVEDAVPNQSGIAEAVLIELGNQFLLVVGIFFLVEFLALEQVHQAHIPRLLHRRHQLGGLHVVVAEETDFLDFDFPSLGDGEIDADGTFDERILGHLHIHLDIQEAFFLEKALDDADAGLFHIIGELAAATQGQAVVHQIFLLALLDAGESPAGDPRALDHLDDQVRAVAGGGQGIQTDGYIFELALGPQAIHDGGNIITRQGDGHSFAQAAQLDNLVRTEILVPFHADASDKVFVGTGIIDGRGLLRRKNARHREERQHTKNDPTNQFHPAKIIIYLSFP